MLNNKGKQRKLLMRGGWVVVYTGLMDQKIHHTHHRYCQLLIIFCKNTNKAKEILRKSKDRNQVIFINIIKN
jgi:hypothetical protein